MTINYCLWFVFLNIVDLNLLEAHTDLSHKINNITVFSPRFEKIINYVWAWFSFNDILSLILRGISDSILFLEQTKPRVRQTLKPPIRYAEEESRKTLRTENSSKPCFPTTHVRNTARFLLHPNEGNSIHFQKKHALNDNSHPVIPIVRWNTRELQ